MSLTKFGKKLLCFLALVAFGFAIVACQNSGDVNEPSEAQQLAEEHVEEIYGKIFWDETAMSDISSNLTLVTKTMYEDTTVSWASSHADIISPEGVVTRPSYDHEEAVSVNPNDPEEKDKHVAVELRATIKATYEEDGEVKEAIKYKEFTFTVLCLAEGLKVTSIAEAKAAAYQYIYEEMGVAKELVSNPDVIYNVQVVGKVTAILNASGAGQFMIHDGTEGIYVYKSVADLKIGDVVEVVGGIYSYYGNLQIAKDVTVTKVEKEITVPAHTEISIDEWEKSVADLSQVGYHGGKLYKLYAKLEKVEANVAKDIFKLTDPYTAEVAWIYYKSYSAEQQAILEQYDGKYVYIAGVTYDRDSRLLKNHLMWDGGIEEAGEPTLSDEQKLGQVVAEVEALAGSYVAGSLLALPVENTEYAATIEWTIPAGAPYADGKFALVESASDFVATAVVKVAGLEQIVEVKFTVNPIQNVTVAQAMALPVGSTVKLSGTIDVLFGSKGNYYLKDATGSLLVYVGAGNGIQVNGETVTVKAGDKVTFIGETAVFNGCPQIGKIVAYEKHEAAEWSMSVPQEATVAEIKAYTLETAPYGQYLMVRGTLVKSGSYYYLADGEQQISLYNSNVGEELAAVADTETQVTLFVYFYGFQKADLSGDTRVIFNGREGEYFIGDEEVVLPTERTYKTIEEAKALATSAGVELTLRGVVTFVGPYSAQYGNFGALIADATGGLYLYRVAGEDAHAKLVVGDEVELTGLMKVYNGLYELCNVNAGAITVISSGNKVEVVPMSNDIADQSKVVELTNALWNGSAFEKDGQTYAYFYSSTFLVEKPTLVAGYVYNVKGWVNWYNAAQITPIEAPVVVEANHEHAPCPECGKCTAEGCDGEVCTGHGNLPTEGVVTLAQAIEIAMKQAHDTYTTGKFTVTGTVTDLYNTKYGNMHLIDADGNDLTIYGMFINGTQYGSYTGAKPVEGDVITVTGILGTYNGKPQMKNADLVVEAGPHKHVACPTCGLCTDPACDGTDAEKCPTHEVVTPEIIEVTVAEFLAAAESSTQWYKLTGTIANIANTTYGNFDLVDESGSIYVYGLTATQVASNDKSFASLGLKEGDVVTLIGTRASYNGAAQVGGPSYYVSHVEGVTPDPEPNAPVKYLFSSYTAGTQYAQGENHALDANTTLTVNGGHLNTQLRLYADSHTIIASQKTMTQIVVNGGYKVATLNVYSSADGTEWVLVAAQATATSYKDYTFELGADCKYVKLEAVGAQVRVAYATITFGAAGETPEPSHEHVACPECGKCTAEDCDGADDVKCAGHEVVTPEIIEATVAEILAAEVSADQWYKLTGVISNIANTTYGNFDLVDESGSIYVYGLTATQVASNDKSFASLGLKEGDTVTLIGTRAAYNGAAQVGGPAYYVSHVAAPHAHVQCPTCGLCTAEDCDGTAEEKCAGHEGVAVLSATITFDNTSKRTEFSTEKQVWEENGVKVTNEKGGSTSNVADYVKPARFYKSSTLIVEASGKNINKIVVTVNDTKYATALTGCSFGDGVTVSANGKVVTIEFEATSSFSVVLSGGQVRVDSIEVFFAE